MLANDSDPKVKFPLLPSDRVQLEICWPQSVYLRQTADQQQGTFAKQQANKGPPL